MRITIDNLDGNGAVNYTAALSGSKPITISRKLNEMSLCNVLLDLTACTLPVPMSGGRVIITADGGALLFTGYVGMQPEYEYKGAGIAGHVSVLRLQAVSDDLVLNQTPLQDAPAVQGQTAGSVLRWTTAEANPRTDTSGIGDIAPVGVFQREAGKNWTSNAGAVASMSRASYQVVNGAVTLRSIGSQTHVFSEGAGTLNLNSLRAAQVKELADDVTLIGMAEPAAYVTELFQGDGATTEFELSAVPFRIAKPKLLNESFTGAALNPAVWHMSDAGSHISVTAAGLTLNGGSGSDGQTVLAAVNPLELGGELVLEAGGVQLNSGSDGIVCGLYSASVTSANCVAGFRVRQSSGTTIVVPYVNGEEAGTSFLIAEGHSYTFRLRVHSAELVRTLQTYYSQTASGVRQHGGDSVAGAASLLFEVQDQAASAGTRSTILLDGSISSSPGVCTFGGVNSRSLNGAVRYMRVTQPGTAWGRSQPAGGATYTRRIGLAVEGADCQVASTGKVRFLKAGAPAAGELLTVIYRTSQQSIARLARGTASTGYWAGKVSSPAARCSADCENAAAAVLDFSTDADAAVSGKYADINLHLRGDVWPGDRLSFQGTAQTVQATTRTVQIVLRPSSPELAEYSVTLANDWEEDLSLKLSADSLGDSAVPLTAANGPAQVAASLPALSVTAISSSAIVVSANATPPANGGFEVRSRDGNFGMSCGQDLVMRSPVPNFVLPRAAESQEFFVRIYDGSTPPLYSRYSSAVFTNVPVV